MIGIALEQVFFRHAVEGRHDHVGLEIEGGAFGANGFGQRLDIGRIIMPGGGNAHARLPAHFHEGFEGFVAGSGRRCGAGLRIERDQQNTITALRHQGLDALRRRGIAIAHAPIDHNAIIDGGEALGEFFGLRAGDGFERALIALLVPDRVIILALGAGTDREDDEIEDRPPDQARDFNDALIGQEFLEIAPHGPVIGGVGRAQIEQQNADLADADDGMPVGQRANGLVSGVRAGHHVHSQLHCAMRDCARRIRRLFAYGLDPPSGLPMA